MSTYTNIYVFFQGLDYHWYHTGTIHAQSKVTALSCNHDGINFFDMRGNLN